MNGKRTWCFFMRVLGEGGPFVASVRVRSNLRPHFFIFRMSSIYIYIYIYIYVTVMNWTITGVWERCLPCLVSYYNIKKEKFGTLVQTWKYYFVYIRSQYFFKDRHLSKLYIYIFVCTSYKVQHAFLNVRICACGRNCECASCLYGEVIFEALSLCPVTQVLGTCRLFWFGSGLWKYPHLGRRKGSQPKQQQSKYAYLRAKPLSMKIIGVSVRTIQKKSYVQVKMQIS
jgi:hypothetical protein